MSAYRNVPLRKLQKQRAAMPEEFAWDIHDRSEVDATLARAAKGAEASDATCVLHAAGNEDPVASILTVAKEEEADLIVVGNRVWNIGCFTAFPTRWRTGPKPPCSSWPRPDIGQRRWCSTITAARKASDSCQPTPPCTPFKHAISPPCM